MLTGITRADRWTELRAAALALVLERAREVADVVVVDTGFCLEADEELSFDTMAPRRNAATLQEPGNGRHRLRRRVPRIPSACRGWSGDSPSWTAAVPQRVPASGDEQSPGRRRGPVPGRQLREAWERYGPAAALSAFLPADPAASDAALLSGSLLLEAAPESRLRPAIAASGLCTCPAK